MRVDNMSWEKEKSNTKMSQKSDETKGIKMNKEKLWNGLIEKGENERVEFKENFDRETIETATAFANTKGGTILIGITDRGKTKGIEIGKETLKNWAHKISQATEPTIIPEIETQKLEGKTIVSIKIKESPLKPVSYKGICYTRVKNSNKKLSPKEISELHLQTVGSSWDSYPARNATSENIDFKKVEEYIKLANQTGRRNIKGKPLETLRKLELIKNEKPTWAGILLFGKEPQRFLSQAKVHCGRFKGETTIIDDQLIEGNLIEQVDKVMEFVKRNLKLEFVITAKPKREEIWEYPLDAIREALINAIVHRDYTEPSDIQIRIYDDELIVWSPGGLPSGITLEELYKPHKSVLRNKLIAQIFFDIGFIERWGTGVGRIIELCENQDLPPPTLEEYQGFRVIFKRPFSKEELKKLGLNERQIKAVNYVRKEGEINNKKYQNITSVSRQTATRELSDLTQKNIFKQIGTTGKGTCYQLTQTPHKRLTNASKNSQRGQKR